MANVEVVKGDLLDQNVGVLWLLLPQGISGAIKRRGGNAPFRELAKHGPIPLGGAVLTGPGKLPFKAIIHVAGISMWWRSSEHSIRDSCRNALVLAEENGFESIAFPLIGAGTGGGSADAVLDLMKDEFDGSGFAGRVVIVQFQKS